MDTNDALPEGMTPDLLALLRCPLGRSPLRWDAVRECLICDCGVGFPFINGYANLTGDADATELPPDASATLPCGASRPQPNSTAPAAGKKDEPT